MSPLFVGVGNGSKTGEMPLLFQTDVCGPEMCDLSGARTVRGGYAQPPAGEVAEIGAVTQAEPRSAGLPPVHGPPCG